MGKKKQKKPKKPVKAYNSRIDRFGSKGEEISLVQLKDEEKKKPG